MYKIPLQNRMLQMLKKMEEFHFAGKCELQNKGCLQKFDFDKYLLYIVYIKYKIGDTL